MLIPITTKKLAMDQLTNSLFEPVNGHSLSVGKYCAGKHRWTGSQAEYVGREVDDLGGTVRAVFVERRRDKNGSFAQLMSVHADSN